MKVEIELPEIEGFEYTGECRFAESDIDYFMYGNDSNGAVSTAASGMSKIKSPIQRKIKQYRNLTRLEAMSAIVENGGPIKCEMRSCENSDWREFTLIGIKLLAKFPFESANDWCFKCRIEV